MKTKEQYLSHLKKTFWWHLCINISSYKHNTKLNSSDTQTPFNILPLLSKSSVNTISHWIQKQLLYQFCVHNTDSPFQKGSCVFILFCQVKKKKKAHKKAWSIESITYKITFQNVNKSDLKQCLKVQSFPRASPDFYKVQYRHNPLGISPVQASLKWKGAAEEQAGLCPWPYVLTALYWLYYKDQELLRTSQLQILKPFLFFWEGA